MPFGAVNYVKCQKGIVDVIVPRWLNSYKRCIILRPAYTDETHNICLDQVNVMNVAQWLDDLISQDCISTYFEKESSGWSCVESSDANVFLSKEFPFDNENPHRKDTDGAAICVEARPDINTLGFPYYTITIRDHRPDPLIYPEDDPGHFEIECTFANIKTFSKLFYSFLSHCPSYVFMDNCEDEIRKLKETIKSMKKSLEKIEEKQKPDEEENGDKPSEYCGSEDLPDEVVSDSNERKVRFEYFVRSYDEYDLDKNRLLDANNSIYHNLQTIKAATRNANEASAVINQYNIFRDLFNDGKYSCNSLLNKFRHKEISNLPVTTVLTMASILSAAYFYKLENKTYTPENPEEMKAKLYKPDGTSENYIGDVYVEAASSLGIMYDQPDGICFTNEVMKEDYKNFKDDILHIITFSYDDDDKYKELDAIEKYVCSGNYHFSLLSYRETMTIKEEMALVLALRDIYFMLTFAESELTPFFKSEYVLDDTIIMIDLVRALLISVVKGTRSLTTKGCYKMSILDFEECVRAFYKDSEDALDLYNSALVDLLAYESVADKTPENKMKYGFPVDFHYD